MGADAQAVLRLIAQDSMSGPLNAAGRSMDDTTQRATGLADRLRMVESVMSIVAKSVYIGQAAWSAFSGVMGALPSAVVGVSSALLELSQSAAQNVSKINSMATAVGIAPEKLQALQKAAAGAGVGTEALGSGLRALTAKMQQAAEGNEQAAAMFTKLGVSIKNADGSLRSSDAVLAGIADKFKTLPAGAERTALAMQALGEAGGQLMPILANGSDGLQTVEADLAKLGMTVNKDVVAAAESFSSSWDAMTDSVTAFGEKLGRYLMPAFSATFTAIGQFATSILASLRIDSLATSISETMYAVLQSIPWDAAASAASDMVNQMISFFGAFSERASTYIRAIPWKGMAMGAATSIDYIWSAAQKLINGTLSLLATFKRGWDSVMPAIQRSLDLFVQGWKIVAGGMQSAIERFDAWRLGYTAVDETAAQMERRQNSISAAVASTAASTETLKESTLGLADYVENLMSTYDSTAVAANGVTTASGGIAAALSGAIANSRTLLSNMTNVNTSGLTAANALLQQQLSLQNSINNAKAGGGGSGGASAGGAASGGGGSSTSTTSGSSSYSYLMGPEEMRQRGFSEQQIATIMAGRAGGSGAAAAATVAASSSTYVPSTFKPSTFVGSTFKTGMVSSSPISGQNWQRALGTEYSSGSGSLVSAQPYSDASAGGFTSTSSGGGTPPNPGSFGKPGLGVGTTEQPMSWGRKGDVYLDGKKLGEVLYDQTRTGNWQLSNLGIKRVF